MGDFLLDLRPAVERNDARVGEFLRFFEDIAVTTIADPEFGTVLTSADDARLWAPAWSVDRSLFVGVCGRLALDAEQWAEAARCEGEGGFANRYLLHSYTRDGLNAICQQCGHFVIILIDRRLQKIFLVTDRWGIAPVFRHENLPVFSSHPDALSDAVGDSEWDHTSLAEFVLTCRLSFPFTYYRRIRSLPPGTVTTLDILPGSDSSESAANSYLAPTIVETSESVERLSEELARGLRRSVAKRTIPLLGKSALALSGGLDSRAILAAAPHPNELTSFCCYDEENEEFRIARAVARELKSTFVPLKRQADYYADSAIDGVRISAGMGVIASNHFLGFRDELRDLGDNILTGCYCDYIFKGLALNTRAGRFGKRESLAEFAYSYYASHLAASSLAADAVHRRLEETFPEDLRRYDSPRRVAEVERRRMFPLSYEEDAAARIIPQRVLGWYTPMAENDLFSVYLRMSTAMKLNRSLFAQAVSKICDANVCAIPDANTGQPVSASAGRVAVGLHLRRAGRALRRVRRSHAGTGSWPNWSSYVARSRKIEELWEESGRESDELFADILGKERYSPDHRELARMNISAFLRVFTLRLWMYTRRS